MYLDGHDLRQLPLLRRKQLLEHALPDIPYVQRSEHITEHGKPGRYPATVADPVTQDQVASTAEDLTQHAPTTAGHIGLS